MRHAIAVAAALWVLAPASAHAQKPTTRASEYSPYEKEAIEVALREQKLELDPAPEGKTIGTIKSVRLEVLEPRDPGPELLRPIPIVSPLGKYVTKPMLNKLHTTTKEWIIRRELLLHEGDEYAQVLVDETARNMRSRMPFQVSLVVLLPIKNPDPKKVDLLMLTKDIWSLRASFNIVGTAFGIEDLILAPQETNFLGQHHTLATNFRMQPETLSFGASYRIPRFGMSWIGAGASAGVIFNRRSGEPEGSSIGLSAGQGLYSTRTNWAWDVDVGYSIGVARRYSNAAVVYLNPSVTPDVDEAIPWQYRTRSFSASASLTRSFGWAIKNNFALAMNASTADYDTFGLQAFDPRAVAAVRARILPTSESRVYPSFGWRSFKNDFLRTLNINTLSLQEDYRLGHDVSVSVYPVFKALGSSRDVYGMSQRIGYSWALGDGIFGASLSRFAEVSENVITDASISGAFGAATPRIKHVGRFVINMSASNRYRNYLKTRTFAGGEDRLRGYPTAFFEGKDTVFLNMEFRSRPFELLKAQIGGVAFMDAGDAAYGLDNLQIKKSVGAGVRVLLPQLNRNVFRFDVAFPIDRGPFPNTGVDTPVNPWTFFFAFDQAFAP